MSAGGWPNPARPGFPARPEQDSTGHVIRLDGDALPAIYNWSAGRQWFEDEGGRWVAPADLVKDGDHYLGQIDAPSPAPPAPGHRISASDGNASAVITWTNQPTAAEMERMLVFLAGEWQRKAGKP